MWVQRSNWARIGCTKRKKPHTKLGTGLFYFVVW
jgi:hypothetical protein